MSKQKCGHTGQIRKRICTSTIRCYKMKCRVTISVTKEGKECLNSDCPHNPGRIATTD